MHAALNRMDRNRRHNHYSRLGFLELMPEAGNAIRVIDPDHELRGQTGLALKLEIMYGKPRMAVRMDESQKVVYLPLTKPPTDVDKSQPTLWRIPKCGMMQVPTPVSDKWREDVRTAVTASCARLCCCQRGVTTGN